MGIQNVCYMKLMEQSKYPEVTKTTAFRKQSVTVYLFTDATCFDSLHQIASNIQVWIESSNAFRATSLTCFTKNFV